MSSKHEEQSQLLPGPSDHQGERPSLPSSFQQFQERSSPVGPRPGSSRVPSGSDSPMHGAVQSGISPLHADGVSGSTMYDRPQNQVGDPHSAGENSAKHTLTSSRSSHQPPIDLASAADLLPATPNDRLAPEPDRRSNTEVKHTWLTLVSLTVLALAIYGTIMSAIFLVIAIHRPRYKRHIGTKGLKVSAAALLTTFFAKTIELSFVTVIVALLGQILARKAHSEKEASSITLAELGMRSWILQPGTVITNWEGVRYAGATALGVLSLLATLLATLYVTAANAVVQPQLRFLDPERTVMHGIVKASFANPTYLKQQCKTPIPWESSDSEFGGTTCLQLQHTASAYHNYFAYLGIWEVLSKSGNGTSDLRSRPKGFALLDDNTTITAPWIEHEFHDMAKLYDEYGLVVVNVSMAMPHVGVANAAMDPINNIVQPEELDGRGVYHVHASVPSPVVNVLCAMLSEKYLGPFIYEEPNSPSDPYIGDTPLHKLFRWGESHGEYKWPPTFAKVPPEHNTIINETRGMKYGRESTYLLGNATKTASTGDYHYPLCQIAVSMTPRCSTWYNASSSGATMEAICEDTNDRLMYSKSVPSAIDGNASLVRDWSNVGGKWIKSLGLNSGSVGTNGSNSRALLQLSPTQPDPGKHPSLNPILPSIAEALAVMAGCTLIMSAKDSPFVGFWNYTSQDNIIEPGKYENFNACIEAQEYASGGTYTYQRAFISILFAVFLLNLLALAYFVGHRSWYDDVSEPNNLFSLAINSPPCKELASGGGPHGKQFRSPWKMHEDSDGHLVMESVGRAFGSEPSGRQHRKRLSDGLGIMMTPIRKAKEGFHGRVSR